jgi:hypothetical protein
MLELTKRTALALAASAFAFGAAAQDRVLRTGPAAPPRIRPMVCCIPTSPATCPRNRRAGWAP